MINLRCEECDVIGVASEQADLTAADSCVICWSCFRDHVHVGLCRCHPGENRRPIIIGDDRWSPDGVMWHAPDRQRHSDGRPVMMIESEADRAMFAAIPPITVYIEDPLGLLGADHPKCVVIGGTVN